MSGIETILLSITALTIVINLGNMIRSKKINLELGIQILLALLVIAFLMC